MDKAEPYLHLTPANVWERQAQRRHFVPDAFAEDGFIHLTIGEANLLEVANLFYKGDNGDFVVLTLDQTRITAPVRFDDDSGRYPHVYGHLDTAAVVAVSQVRRGPDGTFLEILRD